MVETRGDECKLAKRVKGLVFAMVTPLQENGELSKERTRNLVNRAIKAGVHALFPAGTAGESCLLSNVEKKKIVEIVVDEANGRIPVYAGTGTPSTQETVDLTRHAKDVGADGAVVLTPYYIKPSKEELFCHYKTIADAVDIPIILYTNPGRTGGVDVTPDLLERLVQECSNVVCIKDSSNNMDQTIEYIKRCGDKVSVLEGIDSMLLAALVMGVDGAVSGPTLNVAPELHVGIYNSYLKGDLKKAAQLQQKVVPLWTSTCRPSTLGTYPATVKAAMNMMGIKVGPPKSPILPLPEGKKKELKVLLKDLGLIKE